MKLTQILIGFLFLLIVADVLYKSSHFDCRPEAPWFLKAMEHECQGLKERAEEAANERARREVDPDD